MSHEISKARHVILEAQALTDSLLNEWMERLANAEARADAEKARADAAEAQVFNLTVQLELEKHSKVHYFESAKKIQDDFNRFRSQMMHAAMTKSFDGDALLGSAPELPIEKDSIPSETPVRLRVDLSSDLTWAMSSQMTIRQGMSNDMSLTTQFSRHVLS